MKLAKEQLQTYHDKGYLLIPSYFTPTEVMKLKVEIDRLAKVESEATVCEENRPVLKAIHGCHLNSELMSQLIRHPKILEPIKQILGDSVYVHQFKVNFKYAFEGGSWSWHQDFTHWHNEDGIANSNIANAVVYLDDVNAFNGALYLIPQSHTVYTNNTTVKSQSGWIAKHRADLKYVLDKELVASLINRYGYECMEAPAGSILFFHSNVAHASPENISPFDRRLLIISYNDIHNPPDPHREKRAEFLVGRDYSPLQTISEEEANKVFELLTTEET